MTALELAKLIHGAHLQSYLDCILDQEFGFLPMEWEKTHMKYQGRTVAIAEEILNRITIAEKGKDNE